MEKLKFGWDEVHEIAEELEHISSKKLIDKLDEFLEFPRTDPHGDPIPDDNGKFERVEQLNLLQLPLNHSAEISSVTDQSSGILELLSHKNLAIGTRLEVKKKFGFDNSVEIKIRNAQPVTISEDVAKNIFVKYDQQD